MALPPITPNSPSLRVLSGSQSRPAAESQAAEGPSSREDTVSLSDDALRKLDELKSKSIETDHDARARAKEARADLEENQDATLGLSAESGS